jgi:allantoicase
MFPDGGISRLKAYGVIQRDWSGVKPNDIVDLAAVENGARPVAFSDAHYGRPVNLLSMGRGVNMGSGWETARNLYRPEAFEEDEHGNMIIPGNEWVILRLGTEGVIRSVDVDTHFFKGNFPESVTLEGCYLPDAADESFDEVDFRKQVTWVSLLERAKLGPSDHHLINLSDNASSSITTHVRMTIFPDGGVMRLRLYGSAQPLGKAPPVVDGRQESKLCVSPEDLPVEFGIGLGSPIKGAGGKDTGASVKQYGIHAEFSRQSTGSTGIGSDHESGGGYVTG